MKRAYYQNSIRNFCQQTAPEILGEIASKNDFALEQKQRDAWIKEISILQHSLSSFCDGGIVFEYSIPRIGARIDNVFIYQGTIYIFEFKVGESGYPKHAIEQVLDYALDLKYFHQASQARIIVPILVCTHAPNYNNTVEKDAEVDCKMKMDT